MLRVEFLFEVFLDVLVSLVLQIVDKLDSMAVEVES